GYITDDLFKALNEQFRVLDAFAAYKRAQGQERRAPFYGFSIPLAPAPQVKTVGEPPNVGQIYPMLAQVPTTIDQGYLKEHLIPAEILTHIRQGLLEE